METRPIDTTDCCQIARANVHQAVRVERRFPLNVFAGHWTDFVFFDSDWMSQPDFVGHIKTFLEIEGGQCACLWKLETEDPDARRFFCVRDQTTADEYRAVLAGTRPGYGWLNAMERLTCASDRGEWCMYCEPNNEIAVVGFRHPGASARYLSAIDRFRAVPIEAALNEPLSYGFAQAAASPEWRDVLLREYQGRSL